MGLCDLMRNKHKRKLTSSDIEKGLIYDTDIVLGLSYTYEIEAVDFDGNKSENKTSSRLTFD